MMDKEQRIGTCESGEIAFNLDAFERLYKGNIIITKRLTNELIKNLVYNKAKIILHITCTGFGGSVIEPMVPKTEETLKKTKELIEAGFPTNQIVLRIDPIVPTDKGINTATSVLKAFGGLKIDRVRISFMDNYKHVVERFKQLKIDVLYGGQFHAPIEDRLKALYIIKECAKECGFKSVEACGEPGIESIPCISQKDIDILGLTDEITLVGSAEQRKSCHCPANKSELLKVKPHRCEHKCLYCYWKE